jgi:transcriptional regulator of arginine metabolism
MKNKLKRLQEIKEIISTSSIASQEELLEILSTRGYELTQATLSRDLKQLKVVKSPTAGGTYKYVLPERSASSKTKTDEGYSFVGSGFLSITFSGLMAVMKTRPGYASSIAYEIDEKAQNEILGTVAGEDTILLVIDEKVSREAVIKSLSSFIPNIL